MANSVLRREQEALARWGLGDRPPFPNSGDELSADQLRHIVVGRDQLIDEVLMPLTRGENVLVRGEWGAGKTTYILRLMQRLLEELRDVGHKGLMVYINCFYGGTPAQFQAVIMRALAEILADHDREVQRQLEDARGRTQVHKQVFTSAAGVEPSIEAGSPQLVKISLGANIGAGRERAEEVTYRFPEANLLNAQSLLAKARQHYDTIVIAVDDLDKAQPDAIGGMQAMLEGCLALLRSADVAFLLTGRRAQAFADVYASTRAAVYDHDQVIERFVEHPNDPDSPVKEEEMAEIAIRVLNTVRKRPRRDTFPYDDSTIRRIARLSMGLPRQFNRICRLVMDFAIRNHHNKIDDATLDGWLSTNYAISVRVNLDRDLLALLGKIARLLAVSPETEDEKLHQFFAVRDFAEFRERYQHQLSNLQEKNLIIVQQTPLGPRFIPAAGLQGVEKEII